jgi:hypothetical protein
LPERFGRPLRITEESVNRSLKVCLVSALLSGFVFSALSSPVSADDTLTLYTEYTQYDNNETLRYFIVGSNNSTYQVFLFHRDSPTPLVIAYARTGENSTKANGSIGLYEIDNFGWLTLKAHNKSNNESATTDFRLVPSLAWWEGEVDGIIADANEREGRYLYIIFALCMTIIIFLGVGYLRMRDKVKEATGELTLGDRLLIAKPWDYDTYADDIAEDHPQAQSERAHLKFKMVWWRLLDILKMKKELRDYESLLKEEKELKAMLPSLFKDLISEKEAAGILKEGQWDGMTTEERYAFLHPGERKEALSG